MSIPPPFIFKAMRSKLQSLTSCSGSIALEISKVERYYRGRRGLENGLRMEGDLLGKWITTDYLALYYIVGRGVKTIITRGEHEKGE